MLFNSITFLIFFPVVCLLYWLLTPRLRNGMLLIASYYFYMNWGAGVCIADTFLDSIHLGKRAADFA